MILGSIAAVGEALAEIVPTTVNTIKQNKRLAKMSKRTNAMVASSNGNSYQALTDKGA